MQLIRDLDTQIKTRGINHRVGTFRYKELGEGEPGTPGNYNLRMVWSQTDFFSPRHRHNFDQVRVQMTGTFSFDDDGVMRPGVMLRVAGCRCDPGRRCQRRRGRF